MPGIIDPQTMYIDDLPGIWSPVQWEMTSEEHAQELEQQATASLLWAIDGPEAILRLLLEESAIERSYGPPEGYNPEMQGEWNSDLITFEFKRPIRLERVERDQDYLYVEYNFDNRGYWSFEIEPEKVTIQRL